MPVGCMDIYGPTHARRSPFRGNGKRHEHTKRAPKRHGRRR